MRDEALLIIGRRSYIGGVLAQHARARGADVRAVDSSGCDLLDAGCVDAFFRSLDGRPHDVVLLAVLNKSPADTYATFQKNLSMVRNVIVSHAHANVRSILYFSSVDVYGRLPPLPITEATPIAPDTWYALAKHSCEWMLCSSGEVRCPVTVLRIPGIFGCAPRDPSVIGRMVRMIEREARIVIHGNGRARRDFVWLEDLCRLVLALLPLRHAGVLNVATGTSLPIIEIALLVGRILGRPFEIVHGPPEEAREFDLAFDNSSLTSLVPGFRFSDIEAGIRTYGELNP